MSRSVVKLHLCCTLGRNPGSLGFTRVSLLMRKRLAGKSDDNDEHGLCFYPSSSTMAGKQKSAVEFSHT